MSKKEITINIVTPPQRKNSRWKFSLEEYLANGRELFSAKISADKKEITIFGKQYNKEFSKTFKIGDVAEYDSYNLIYLGDIVKISEKSVTIEEHYSTRKHRLDLYTFISKNWDFDHEEILEKNAEISMSI